MSAPAPFAATGSYAPVPLIVDLPGSATQTELTGAANVLARLGEEAFAALQLARTGGMEYAGPDMLAPTGS